MKPTPPGPRDFSKNTWDLPADADMTKNPVEATEESISKGKELFMTKSGNCIFCHGETGSGNKENLPQLRRVPADLSNHERMSKLSAAKSFGNYQRYSRHYAKPRGPRGGGALAPRKLCSHAG